MKLWLYISNLLIFLLGTLIPISSLAAGCENADITTEIRVFIVHSYNRRDVCTAPQDTGIRDIIGTLSEKTSRRFIIRSVYLETKAINISTLAREKVADLVMEEVDTFKPCVVMTTDDDAFRLVGIPLAKKGYQIIFSGLNTPYASYIEEFPFLEKAKVVGIVERVDFKPVLNLFTASAYVPNKYYIIKDKNSTAGYALLHNYLSEFKKYNLPTPEIIEYETVVELRRILIELNSKPNGCIIIVGQTVRDEDEGRIRAKRRLVQEIVAFNKKHIEIGANPLFACLGLSICCGPDFLKMGRQAGHLLSDIVESRIVAKPISVAQNTLAVNVKRLHDLGESRLLHSKIKLIDIFYDRY